MAEHRPPDEGLGNPEALARPTSDVTADFGYQSHPAQLAKEVLDSGLVYASLELSDGQIPQEYKSLVDQEVVGAYDRLRNRLLVEDAVVWIVDYTSKEHPTTRIAAADALEDYVKHQAIINLLADNGLLDNYFNASIIPIKVLRFRHLTRDSSPTEEWETQSWAIPLGYIPKERLDKKYNAYLSYEFRYGDEFNGHRYSLVAIRHNKKLSADQLRNRLLI